MGQAPIAVRRSPAPSLPETQLGHPAELGLGVAHHDIDHPALVEVRGDQLAEVVDRDVPAARGRLGRI